MPLHTRDQGKLLNAGFTIIRPDYQRLKIKHKRKDQREWKDIQKTFPTKAALDREMQELLKCSTIIQD